MPAATNPLKPRLAARDTLIGLWLNASSPVSAEIAGAAGFDWCLIDGEHAPYAPETIAAQLRALDLGGTPAIVRLPVGEDWIVKQVLDLGARTLMVPMVDTAEQAADLIRATRYPPEGRRGVGGAVARVTGWGRQTGYAATANREIAVIVQAESARALDNLDDILAVDGVDAVFIGPADLSADMGHLDNPGAPEVQAAIADAGRRIRAAGKSAGIYHYGGGDYARYLAEGFNFIAAAADVTLLRTGCDAILAKARKATGG